MYSDTKKGKSQKRASDYSTRSEHSDGNSEEISFGGLIKASFGGAVAAVICSVLLLLVFSITAYAMPDPNKPVDVFALVCLFLSSLTGGFFACKKYKKAPLPCGLLSGVLFMLLTLAASMFIPDDMNSNNVSPFVLRLCIPIVSALGGLLYMRISTKKQKKPRGMSRRVPKR